MKVQLIMFIRKIRLMVWSKIHSIFLERSMLELSFKVIQKKCWSWYVLYLRKLKLSGSMIRRRWSSSVEQKLMMRNWWMMISLLKTLFVSSFWSFIFTLTNRLNQLRMHQAHLEKELLLLDPKEAIKVMNFHLSTILTYSTCTCKKVLIQSS